MKKIECIMRPNKLDDVIVALNQYGVRGMTVTQVMGCGLQKGHREIFRGKEFDIHLQPKIKIEIVTTEQSVDSIVKLIREKAYTGEVGDGKIFIAALDNAIRIRTGEEGNQAI